MADLLDQSLWSVMEHVVFSAAVDGVGEEFRRVSNLEEAVRVVEHLRNDLGIEDASVFALTPVPLAFRTYYRVEVPGAEIAPLELVSESAIDDELPEESEPVPSLVPLLAPAPSVEALELVAQIADAEVAEVEDLGDTADESDVHQISELPAMLAPGLEPRDAESEHSLGYFTR
jgi:hypothetical protein